MKRITLFSTLTGENDDFVLSNIFPSEIKNKNLAYIPSGGVEATAQKYIDEWKTIADKYNARFTLIDNTKENESSRLLEANILVISGGNTFALLKNMRQSGLDKAVKEFATKTEFSLAGFSAGAIVMTPTIEICNLPDFDVNKVGIEDLSGLGIVDFEVFPHYNEQQNAQLEDYRRMTKNNVKPIEDGEFLTINL